MPKKHPPKTVARQQLPDSATAFLVAALAVIKDSKGGAKDFAGVAAAMKPGSGYMLRAVVEVEPDASLLAVRAELWNPHKDETLQLFETLCVPNEKITRLCPKPATTH